MAFSAKVKVFKSDSPTVAAKIIAENNTF